MQSRTFFHQHPTFGTAKRTKSSSHWEKSIYYWWFEYLRRNEGYKKTCTQGGLGQFSELYKDFGDIHSLDFKTWWGDQDRGAELFAEPKSERLVEKVTTKLLDSEIENSELLIVKFPLNLSKRYLKQQLNKLLDKHHKGKRGHRYAKKSKAKYVVTGQPNIAALRLMLQIHDYRHANPDLTLWEIARDLKLFRRENMPLDSDTPKIRSDKKNTMAATVSRYLRKSSILIANVALGKF